MKFLIPITLLLLSACCGHKKSAGRADTVQQPITDTLGKIVVPPCIDAMIAQFKKEAVQNPPRKIYRYSYRNSTVYYVPALCCDFFSELYNDSCKLIGHPDGGITGRGDGSMPDFHSAKKDETIIWEDMRNGMKN